MYVIKKKPKTPNMIWDKEHGKPLCKFEKGEIKTNDEALAKKLKALGHTVTGKADKAEQAEPEKEPAAPKAATRRARK